MTEKAEEKEEFDISDIKYINYPELQEDREKLVEFLQEELGLKDIGDAIRLLEYAHDHLQEIDRSLSEKTSLKESVDYIG